MAATRRRRSSVCSSTCSDDQEVQFNWNHTLLKVAACAASHPLEYVKFLIQIGHEPLPPTPSRTLFNRPALALPGFFRYAGHIKKVDGFCGLYRGLVPKLLENVVYAAVYTNTSQLLIEDEENELSEDSNQNETTLEQKFSIYCLSVGRRIAAKCTAIVVTQPFHVITLRSMAQFVGCETKYSSLFSSISEIYNQDGILGFFAGLIPRIVGEILTLFISSSISLIVNTYIWQDQETKQYTSSCISFVVSTLTYPFQLVANIMAVNNSNLVATSYPNMMYYADWTDCWSHLSTMRQLNRGSSLLWRYYKGPTLLHADGTLGPSMPPRFKQSLGVVNRH